MEKKAVDTGRASTRASRGDAIPCVRMDSLDPATGLPVADADLAELLAAAGAEEDAAKMDAEVDAEVDADADVDAGATAPSSFGQRFVSLNLAVTDASGKAEVWRLSDSKENAISRVNSFLGAYSAISNGAFVELITSTVVISIALNRNRTTVATSELGLFVPVYDVLFRQHDFPTPSDIYLVNRVKGLHQAMSWLNGVLRAFSSGRPSLSV